MNDAETVAATDAALVHLYGLHGENEPLLRWFRYDHLPARLRPVSRWFMVTAMDIVEAFPRSAERTVALRKLLESKDAAVRCRVADLEGD